MASCPEHAECECRDVTAEAVATIVGLVGRQILDLEYEPPSGDLPPDILIDAFTQFTASVLTAVMTENEAFELMRNVAADIPTTTHQENQ